MFHSTSMYISSSICRSSSRSIHICVTERHRLYFFTGISQFPTELPNRWHEYYSHCCKITRPLWTQNKYWKICTTRKTQETKAKNNKRAINTKNHRRRAGLRAGNISFVVFGDAFSSICVVVCAAGQCPFNYAWCNLGRADSQPRLCQYI